MPWGNYDIDVFVPTINYPQVTPIVVETTKNIERSWDFHISDEGICCLSIPHKLILAKRSGINLINFYRDFIYPFFANHQFKLKTINQMKKLLILFVMAFAINVSAQESVLLRLNYLCT